MSFKKQTHSKKKNMIITLNFPLSVSLERKVLEKPFLNKKKIKHRKLCAAPCVEEKIKPNKNYKRIPRTISAVQKD